MKQASNQKKNNLGFSLVEVLVILASIVTVGSFIVRVVFRDQFREFNRWFDSWFSATFGLAPQWLIIPVVTLYVIYRIRSAMQ